MLSLGELTPTVVPGAGVPLCWTSTLMIPPSAPLRSAAVTPGVAGVASWAGGAAWVPIWAGPAGDPAKIAVARSVRQLSSSPAASAGRS